MLILETEIVQFFLEHRVRKLIINIFCKILKLLNKIKRQRRYLNEHYTKNSCFSFS